ncbi:Protein of unknown function, partial [Gryllus bimaculatus]
YGSELRGDLLAVLDANNASLVAEVLAANASAAVFVALERFAPPVDRSAAWAQTFCFDIDSTDRQRGNILVTALSTRRLNKCCPEGHHLNATLSGCEKSPAGGAVDSGDRSGDEDGAAREVLARCEAPGAAPLLERVRPLQALAVLLLALGAAARGAGGGRRRRPGLDAAEADGRVEHLRCNTLASSRLTSSFFETRTCLSENKLFKKTDGKLEFFEAAGISLLLEKELPHKVSAIKNVGAMYYYYIPMSILVVANGACLVSTVIVIRQLQKNTSAVQNMGSSTGVAYGGLRTALLYVKLLALAGVVEIVLEASVWASRSDTWDNARWLHSTSSSLESAYNFNIVATFLDVARALAVLWLSAGRWAWAARAERAVRRAWRTLRRRAQIQAQEIAQAPRCDSDEVSEDTTTTTTSGL